MATGQSSGKVLEEIRRAGRTRLSEHESKELLRESGLPVTSETRAKTREELVAALKDLAFPVVIKVDSPDISHKTEAGAVKLNCRTVEEALVAFDEVTANAHGYDPAARIDGVLVQEMLSGGVECIIGMKTDAQFGPVVVFGLGGIFVEILQDISVRVAPVTHREALDMIEETKGSRLLQGARGQAPCDVEALAHAIVSLSVLSTDLEEHLSEIDINPLMVFPKGNGVKAADALVILRSL